jgi:hypothetical protein
MRVWFVCCMIFCAVSLSASAAETCEKLKNRLSSKEASRFFEFIDLKNIDGDAVLFNEFASNMEVNISIGFKRGVLKKHVEYTVKMRVDALVAPIYLTFKDVADTAWGSLGSISTIREHIFRYEEQQSETVQDKWDFANYISDKNDNLWLWALKLKISIVDSNGNKIGEGERILVHCPRQGKN